MKIFSTFSGIGGFEVGIQNAVLNFPYDKLPEFVGCSEIDKYAASVYEKHFGGIKNYGDIILHKECAHADGSPFVVEWEDDGVGDTDGGLGESYYVGFGFAGIPERCRVIGNIHENPDLLNPTDSCTLEDEQCVI